MPENRKLPFLDTKISLFDLQNLEKKGFFRTIFIELLKADKIKNVIPNELEINQTKEEFFLKFNINQLKNKKDNQIFVGFCAFTGSIEEARKAIKEKIIQKGCDYLFANPIDLEDQGFGFFAQNEGWLFDTNNMEHYINKTSKIDLANKLITQIISLKK